jgi:hypothetical protein
MVLSELLTDLKKLNRDAVERSGAYLERGRKTIMIIDTISRSRFS